MTQQWFIERLLYVLLLVVFLGTGLLVLILLSFNHKLNQEVQQLQAISEQNRTTLTEVNRDNQVELSYIRCIAGLFATTRQVTLVNLDTCQTQSVVATTPPQSSPAPLRTTTRQSGSSTPAPQPTPTPTTTPAPSPSPLPTPNILQQLLNRFGL